VSGSGAPILIIFSWAKAGQVATSAVAATKIHIKRLACIASKLLEICDIIPPDTDSTVVRPADFVLRELDQRIQVLTCVQ
jgi:hypothetical protein